MRISRLASLLLPLLMSVALTPLTVSANDDPHLWLEEVMGDKAIAWVKERNGVATSRLEASPHFKPIHDRMLEIVNSRERIPAVSVRGEWLYNFWQDATHVRGIWRRTKLTEYKKAAPAWETVLDLDALSKAENDNWVWKGSTCLYPTYDRCLVSLSRGGADAVVIREFDVTTKSFVKDGFALPEAKGSASFVDRDTLYVQTDFGPGTMTASGYARLTKIWQRGTPVASARTVFEGQMADISVSASVVKEKGFPDVHLVRRGTTFYTGEYFIRDPKTGSLSKIDVPADANIAIIRDHLAVTLKTDWKTGDKTWPQGALLLMPMADFNRGSRQFSMLFTPDPKKSLSGYTFTKSYILVAELDNVRTRLYEWQNRGGQWQRREVKLPGIGTYGMQAFDSEANDDYFLNQTDYLTPNTLFLAKAGHDDRERLKSLPAFFDASPLTTQQFEATSKDGTKIPYFVVRAKDAKNDGTSPTLLYGYGGFLVSEQPRYSGAVGASWLARGGTYVVANIRGGGEFGPRWHAAALKENRQRAFDDFIAVAEDLIARKISSPRHLGISGGSNGGLLVGAVMTQRPELFRAVVCAVPLLDMKRYHKLLAGASWVAEYGNPDKPEEWAYISKYSPYQNLKPNTAYPRVFFITSTRDDRVHPGHARKMMAAMEALKQPVIYYENIEGGHGAAANNKQVAYRTALQYAFLHEELK
jgi:prolyl oligopeptidase